MSEHDKRHLSPTQIAGIEQATKAWEAARATGDRAAMDAANAAANAIRAQAGYSGGGDGSQYIQIAPPRTPNVSAGVAWTAADEAQYRQLG